MAKRSACKQYSEVAITSCIRSIKAGKSVYAGCKEFGIPFSTIRYRLSGQWQQKFKPGPHSVLSTEEENKVVTWLCGMQDRGFPVTREALIFKIAEFLSANSRENPFKNNRPGRKWFKAFLRRNPGFSLRTPEQVSTASGRVTENDIRGWFETVDNWLMKNELREVLEDPTRVFNGDETSFYLHPSTKEVIARTGSRNVYEIEQAAGKQNVTVMFTFGASGVVRYYQPFRTNRMCGEWKKGKEDDE
ncbi:uncharacterized protein LOC135697060 [Ochlerotatus camptorhynchus]|uniref:uncharacterized protein LOC135697060 n=1 Tax=Ochlerotatus camptorhynchus TaxID=644619 RepID=UPI0031D173BD